MGHSFAQLTNRPIRLSRPCAAPAAAMRSCHMTLTTCW